MNILFHFLLVICLLLPAVSTADEPSGLDNIGFAAFNLTSPKFNCSNFLSAVEDLEVLHIAFLYNTFGNDFSCLKRLLKDARLQTLEIHLINEPGHRNRRLGAYEFLRGIGSPAQYDRLVRTKNPRLKNKLAQYVVPLQEVLREHLRPHTSLLINPGLESNLSDRSGKILIAWTRELFPDHRVVWNPLSPAPGRRSRANADIIEGHNLSPNINEPCIYNLDGTDVSYPNRPAIGEEEHKEGESKNWVQSGAPLHQLLETFANECEVAYIWTAESNGIDHRNKSFVDPRKRDHNISRRMYETIVQDIKNLARRGEIFPQNLDYNADDNEPARSCDEVRRDFKDGPKRGRLLKQSEFRNRGAVLILNQEYANTKRVELVKRNRVVDVYVQTGRYKDGRILFRSEKSPTTYPFKTYLKLNKNGKKICYKIPNPRIRID